MFIRCFAHDAHAIRSVMALSWCSRRVTTRASRGMASAVSVSVTMSVTVYTFRPRHELVVSRLDIAGRFVSRPIYISNTIYIYIYTYVYIYIYIYIYI